MICMSPVIRLQPIGKAVYQKRCVCDPVGKTTDRSSHIIGIGQILHRIIITGYHIRQPSFTIGYPRFNPPGSPIGKSYPGTGSIDYLKIKNRFTHCRITCDFVYYLHYKVLKRKKIPICKPMEIFSYKN